MTRVQFEVGNTYVHLKNGQAKTNKHGYLNEHRWMMYIKSVKDDQLFKLVDKVHFGCNGWFGAEYA